ncbi:hypothetical protein [Glycomyces buryatensis]|uniref:Uncharacterized protein n=1 Tax=Glycomyces buryatensis TaxID=2570927 RepID=A0A4S8Q085_9ACTN|nr:hypothetical protein [Glycomyces buryatensis]THV33474.1 hypothetical protein FAB82_25365 [Glycomyces buryatensis]
MPNKRHARRTHRDAARLAQAGNHGPALAIFALTAAEYRAWLTIHPDDTGVIADLADLLALTARSDAATGSHTAAEAALAESLDLLTGLDTPPHLLTALQLDLAEAHLRCGRLISAVTLADSAIRSFDDNTRPTDAAFIDLACALARNARILAVAADPDLAVGAADQAARMLMAGPGPGLDGAEARTRLRSVLALAVGLHTGAGRHRLAAAAADRLARHFPDEGTSDPAPAALTLRAALHTAGRLGVYADAPLIERLCPDPAAPDAPPAVSARCDPALAAITLHATAGAVASLRFSHAGLSWRLATEVHYLLDAADRQGERGLRLNFRDHGPVWLAMLLDLTDAVGPTGPLAEDLAVVLDDLVARLVSRHAADDRNGLIARARQYIATHPPGHGLVPAATIAALRLFKDGPAHTASSRH